MNVFLQCCGIARDSEVLCRIWFGVCLYDKLSVRSVESREPCGGSSSFLSDVWCSYDLSIMQTSFFNLTKPHSPQQNCMLNSPKNATELFLQICRKHLPKNFDVKVILSVMLNVKNTMAQCCWRQTFPSEYIGCSQSSQMHWAGSTLQLTAYPWTLLVRVIVAQSSHLGVSSLFGSFLQICKANRSIF